MFPMIFQSLMGPRKSRCDVLSGIIQGWAHLKPFYFIVKLLFLIKTNIFSWLSFYFLTKRFYWLNYYLLAKPLHFTN
jgi:hypothetical protein